MHAYFTRTAQVEAKRSRGTKEALNEQLSALNELHSWLFARMQAFRRRFKHAHASLLASVDANSLQVFLEDVVYQVSSLACVCTHMVAMWPPHSAES
jgi:hypothetical protein